MTRQAVLRKLVSVASEQGTVAQRVDAVLHAIDTGELFLYSAERRVFNTFRSEIVGLLRTELEKTTG